MTHSVKNKKFAENRFFTGICKVFYVAAWGIIWLINRKKTEISV